MALLARAMCGVSSCKHKHGRTSRGFTCFFVVFRRAFHMQSNLKIHQCGCCVVSPPLQLEESVESCEPRPITLQNWHDTVAVVAISPPTRHTPRPCCEPAGQRRAKCRLEHPPRTPPVPHARGWLVKRQTRAAGAGGCLTLGPHAPQAGPVARPPSRTSPAPADAADAGARRGWRVAGGARQGAHGTLTSDLEVPLRRAAATCGWSLAELGQLQHRCGGARPIEIGTRREELSAWQIQ